MKEPDQIKSFYNDKITIGFWAERHRYSLIVNGKAERSFIISPTAATGMINKPALIGWAVGLAEKYLIGNIELLKASKEDIQIKGIIENACVQHNQVKMEAATKGTMVHEWCEEYVKAKVKDRKEIELPEDPQILNGVTAFLSWVKSNKVKFIDSEKLVYSKKHNFAGLMDLKAMVNGKLSVVDFKTSKGIWPEMNLQVSAYRQADEEETGEKYDQSIILHFDKETGDFEVHELEDHENDFKVFLNCLALKKWDKENKKKYYEKNKD